MNNESSTQRDSDEYESSSKDTILNAFLVAGTVAGCALMFFTQGVQSVVA